MERGGLPPLSAGYTTQYFAGFRGVCVSLSAMKRFVIILGVILLILGVTGLVHPSFSYHKQEEVAKIGPLKATVNEEKVVEIPPAVSITMLISGIALILLGPRVK
jgi:hypothetical protein